STLLMMSMWFLTTSLWILRWGVHDWYGAKIGLVSALLFAGHMAHLLLCAIMTQIQYRYEAMTLPAALIPLGYYLVCLLMKYACGPTHNKSPILINHS
ncbi:MAG: hypothetical protein KDD60_11760, partial [Bdellovibrionales bacterium]|nr:hypothetical protein [Bdellovibrionales bacterium]